MNRPLTAPASDIALVIARVIFAVVMFAHGYQKVFINGLGQTTEGFERMAIPVAIVSASFVAVMEVVGALLVLIGSLTTIVCSLYLVEFVGAIVFVHAKNGLFVKEGGAEYVLVICAFALVLAAAGPGRYSLDRWMRLRQAQRDRELAHLTSAPVVLADPRAALTEPVTAAALREAAPVTYRFAAAQQPVVLPAPSAPGPNEEAPSVPAPNSSEHSGPLPVRRSRAAHASR
ncbi:DoxX family membrane protein [Pseudonocardia sp. CA-107938]|uniref:DoxX family protein n=1 Tax=Pseudonocardia sp. CA-107938 TaxID=3240021 RepID=UPI003D8E55E0